MDIFSKIDSDRFGIKVGKITESFFDDKTVENGIDYFMGNDFDVIFARIDFSRLDIINALEKFGFSLKDSQSTLFFPLKNKTKADLPKKFSRFDIREFKPSDIETFVNLTRVCFEGYGHYFADERLNHDDCLDTYGDWAYNSCTNPKVADKIFVADLDGEVIGYLSFKIYNENGKIYAAGGIGAVNPKYRSLGIFRDVTIAGLEWGIDCGFDWEEHNVLVDNFPVNKSFLKLGFKPEKFMVTLHGWMDEINL